MNKKVLTLSAVMASLLFGAHAQAADTRIGVTIINMTITLCPWCVRLLKKMANPRRMFSY